jgi:FkbM family methyltransferase
LKYKTKNLVYRLVHCRIPRLRWNLKTQSASSYRSQFGQDKFVAERMGFKRNGIFVDIGANDGVTLSNSYFFEKELGWTGIAVEPLADAFQQLSQNRDCKLAPCCVSDINGTVDFLCCDVYSGMLSGMISKFHPKHLRSIERARQLVGGTKRTTQTTSVTPKRLLEEHDVNMIDYLSIDTEGGEFDILCSFDFNAVFVHLVTVENNHYDLRIRNSMRRFGFRIVAIAGVDEIYENTAKRNQTDLRHAA